MFVILVKAENLGEAADNAFGDDVLESELLSRVDISGPHTRQKNPSQGAALLSAQRKHQNSPQETGSLDWMTRDGRPTFTFRAGHFLQGLSVVEPALRHLPILEIR